MASPPQAQRAYSGMTYSQGGALFNGDLHARGDITINHITTVRPFAKSLYGSLTSSDIFKPLQSALASLLAALETTDDNSSETNFDVDHEPELCDLSQKCHRVLRECQELQTHFDNVGAQTRLTWERMGWCSEEVAEMSSKLASYAGMLIDFNSNINLSQARIEQMVKTFIDEVRAGKREGSVVSSGTAESLSAYEKEAWRQMRKELESVGITPAIFTRYQAVIVTTLQKAFLEDDLGGDIVYASRESSGLAQEGLEASPSFGAISLVQSNARQTDDPRQQPSRDQMSPKQNPNMDTPRRSKKAGRLARLLFKMTYGKGDLLMAAARGDAVGIEQLVQKGADIDWKYPYVGMTPLAWAVFLGREAAVKVLLENGAAVNTKDKKGDFPLTNAIKYEWGEAIVKLLLKNGADPNLRDYDGSTPLMHAAYFGDMPIAKLLLDNGADSSIRNNKGKTPLSVAKRQGCKTMIKLLEQHEARNR